MMPGIDLFAKTYRHGAIAQGVDRIVTVRCCGNRHILSNVAKSATAAPAMKYGYLKLRKEQTFSIRAVRPWVWGQQIDRLSLCRNMNRTSATYILTGLVYSILWASASVAGKIGIRTVEPLTFFTTRFLIAGTILLLYTHVLQRSKLPQGKEWKQVTIFGAFNTTLYLRHLYHCAAICNAGHNYIAP